MKTQILFLTALSPSKKSPLDAINYIDSTVTVVDTVSGVYLSKTGTYFINIGGEYPDNAFTVIIFKSDTSKFRDVKNWEGKVMEVTAEIKEYRENPEIVVGRGNR